MTIIIVIIIIDINTMTMCIILSVNLFEVMSILFNEEVNEINV
jgi:hypothetical protein